MSTIHGTTELGANVFGMVCAWPAFQKGNVALGHSRQLGSVPTTSALPLLTDIVTVRRHVSEWDGPAVLPPRTAQRMSWGFEARGAHRHAP